MSKTSYSTADSVALSAALEIAEKCGARIGAGRESQASDIAGRHLAPFVPAGLRGWLIQPRERESARAFARRAARCLIGRCAQAGIGCDLTHAGSETIGMLVGHVRHRAAITTISALERRSQLLAGEAASLESN